MLIESTWLPSGPSGPVLKNRLQQLAAALCTIRDFLAGATNLSVERYIWRWGAVVTEEDIARTREWFGLIQREQVISAAAAAPEPLVELAPVASVSVCPRRIVADTGENPDSGAVARYQQHVG